MWTLQRIFLRNDIPRYQKQQFAHVLVNSRSLKFCKIHRNAPAPESLFNLQPSPLLKKRCQHIYTSVSLADLYYGKRSANWFIKENFTKNGELTFLLQKRDIVKSTPLSKNRHCEGKCIFENHRKLPLNLIVIFTSFTNAYFF